MLQHLVNSGLLKGVSAVKDLSATIEPEVETPN